MSKRKIPLCDITLENISCFTPAHIKKMKNMEPNMKHAHRKDSFGKLIDMAERDLNAKKKHLK